MGKVPAAPIVATGATAGIPGTFTPAGAVVPLAAAIPGLTAAPATAWTVGQYVSSTTADHHWDGAAWVAGRAPAAEPTTRAARRTKGA